MRISRLRILVSIRRVWRFLRDVVMGFKANQGLLLSGAVAFYTLLSIIPMFALLLVGLSTFVPEETLIAIVSENISLVLPDLTDNLVAQITQVYEYRQFVSWVGLGVLLFFSSLAFTVLENALSVIFFHRVAIKRRHFLTSAILPYLFILLVGVGILIITTATGLMQAFEGRELEVLSWSWKPSNITTPLIHIMGVAGHIVLLTSVYLVLPVGKISLRHALIGGIVAGLLWEIVRRILVWYFSTLSFVSVVYGSFAATIVALLSLEAGAIIVLLGAQVIAEYERSLGGIPVQPGFVLHTDAPEVIPEVDDSVPV
ncbi:MAG: YihY/virulence factor BrkB family protein [Rhodothermia bacterium]|nr:YihY/virulence factor BrkB family protein [Rhodothermia bacterium]